MTANKHTPIDVLRSIDHDISIMAGRMATAALRNRWPDAAAQHAALLKKRKQHIAAIAKATGGAA